MAAGSMHCLKACHRLLKRKCEASQQSSKVKVRSEKKAACRINDLAKSDQESPKWLKTTTSG